MPPFIHKCRHCSKLTFSSKASALCKHCQSARVETFRVVRHQPEWVSRRELLILFGAFVFAIVIVFLR